jgi:hypothetical protein
LYTLTFKFNLFIVFWLGAWLVGGLLAIANVAKMLGGSQVLQGTVAGIEIRDEIFGIKRSRHYRAGEIRNLSTNKNGKSSAQELSLRLPFSSNRGNGSIKFDYGARTVFAADGLDEPEARSIVDRLARTLPRSAVAQE